MRRIAILIVCLLLALGGGLVLVLDDQPEGNIDSPPPPRPEAQARAADDQGDREDRSEGDLPASQPSTTDPVQTNKAKSDLVEGNPPDPVFDEIPEFDRETHFEVTLDIAFTLDGAPFGLFQEFAGEYDSMLAEGIAASIYHLDGDEWHDSFMTLSFEDAYRRGTKLIWYEDRDEGWPARGQWEAELLGGSEFPFPWMGGDFSSFYFGNAKLGTPEFPLTVKDTSRAVSLGRHRIEMLDYSEFKNGYYSVEGSIRHARGVQYNNFSEYDDEDRQHTRLYVLEGVGSHRRDAFDVYPDHNGNFSFRVPIPPKRSEWERMQDEWSYREYPRDKLGVYDEEGALNKAPEFSLLWAESQLPDNYPKDGPWIESPDDMGSLRYYSDSIHKIGGLQIRRVASGHYRLDPIIFDTPFVEIDFKVDLGERFMWASDFQAAKERGQTPQAQPLREVDSEDAILFYEFYSSHTTSETAQKIVGNSREGFSLTTTLTEGDWLLDRSKLMLERADGSGRSEFWAESRVVSVKRGNTTRVEIVLASRPAIEITVVDQFNKPVDNVLTSIGDPFPLGGGRYRLHHYDSETIEVYAEYHSQAEIAIGDPWGKYRVTIHFDAEARAADLRKEAESRLSHKSDSYRSEFVEFHYKAPKGWAERTATLWLYWRDGQKESDSWTLSGNSRRAFGGRESLLYFRESIPLDVGQIECYLGFVSLEEAKVFGLDDLKVSEICYLTLNEKYNTFHLSVNTPLRDPTGGRKRFELRVGEFEPDYDIPHLGYEHLQPREYPSDALLAAIRLGEEFLTFEERRLALAERAPNLEIDLSEIAESVYSVKVWHIKSGLSLRYYTYAERKKIMVWAPQGGVIISAGDGYSAYATIGARGITSASLDTKSGEAIRPFGYDREYEVYIAKDESSYRLLWDSGDLPSGEWRAFLCYMGSELSSTSFQVRPSRITRIAFDFDETKAFSASVIVSNIEILNPDPLPEVAFSFAAIGSKGDYSIERQSARWIDGKLRLDGLLVDHKLAIRVIALDENYDEIHYDLAPMKLSPDKVLTGKVLCKGRSLELNDFMSDLGPSKLGGEGLLYERILKHLDGRELGYREAIEGQSYLVEYTAIGESRCTKCPKLSITISAREDFEFSKAHRKAIEEWLAKLEKIVFPDG